MTTKQRAYLKSGYGGASGTGTDQDQRAEKLCGRSVRAGAACGRTYPFPGCAGDRKEDRSVQRGKRQ